jgi:hypothetical protein
LLLAAPGVIGRLLLLCEAGLLGHACELLTEEGIISGRSGV